MKSAAKNFSIKWKLSLALILTGLSLVLVYIFIAKKVFETDKISYVFDSQRSRLSSLNRELDGRLFRTIFSSRSLLATLDSTGKMSPAGNDLFQEDKSLLAIEIWDENSQVSTFHVEKIPGILPSPGQASEKVALGEIKLIVHPDQKFLFVFRPYKDVGASLVARILMDAQDILPVGEARQPTILVKDGQIIASIGTMNFKEDLPQTLAREFSKDDTSLTTIWKYGSQRFLVSSAKLSIGQLKTLVFTPEAEALGALNTLFSRSMVFLAFSVFGLIALSLFLSANLTANLKILTAAATEIGRGNFDKAPLIRSHDEMGILSGAFYKMAKEIQRLLMETRDKARMEAELKTAKLVQESLLPDADTFEYNEMEISGVAITSTECGGDWWYYFVKDEEIYIAIADATGHGTPAALITAAARSVFSRLENENVSLAEMMRAWDFAVSSCSKKRVFMTGILLKIHSRTGHGSYLSAGHEAPYLFDRVEDGFSSTYLDLDMHRALGEGLGELPEQQFDLKIGSSLVLYTDGLFSVEAADGKKLSEKRFGKAISEKIQLADNAQKVTALVLDTFAEHRKDLPLPDDVTVVTLRRKDRQRATSLAGESAIILGGDSSKQI